MFNSGKIRQLEQDLNEANSRLDEAQATIEKYEDVFRKVATALSPKESNALEIITAAASDLVPEEALPQVAFGIEIWDRYQKGVGSQVSDFAQSLGFSLQEFLQAPSVQKISTRIESRRENFAIVYSDVHTVVFTSKCLCELEVCCGAVHTLLGQAFEDRKPKVTTTSFDRQEGTATLQVVIG